MPTVLLAEADHKLRDAHLGFLSRHGCRVDAAADGLECLTKLRQFVPDLLVLDLELAWGGGDGVLALILEDPQLIPAQILLKSSVAQAHVLDGLASAPVVQAYYRPVSQAELIEHATFAKSRARKASKASASDASFK